jgi:predicted ArsR family transcriptional regulator
MFRLLGKESDVKVMCQHGYRSLSIYEALKKHPEGMRVRDLSKQLQICPALTCRYLKTMKSAGLVVSQEGLRVNSEAGKDPVVYRLVTS